MDIFIKLALVLAFGIIGSKFARRLNLPNVTGYIVAGLFLGPSFFNVITEAEKPVVDFVNEIALGIIAFAIGAEFRFADLKRLGKDVFVITVLEVVGVLVLVFFFMYFVMGQSFVFSLVIASMSASTAPAGTVMVMRQYRAYGPLTKTILPITALDDMLGIMAFGICMSIAKMTIGSSDVGLASMVFGPLVEIGLALVLGIGLGFAFTYIIKRVKNKEEELAMVLFVIMLAIGLANYLNLSALLVNMAIGTVLVNYHNTSQKVFDNINDFAPPINLIFFTFAGASLDLSVLASIGGLGLVYVIARALGKLGGATLGAKLVEAKDTIVRYLGLALLPQGGVSIGLSMIVARELPAYADKIITVVLFAVLIFEITGPILAKFAITRAGEVGGMDRMSRKEDF